MGRKKFTKAVVNERLFELGWEIPKKAEYNGMGDEATVIQCKCCGKMVSRLLRNVLYRQETCFCHYDEDNVENQSQNLLLQLILQKVTKIEKDMKKIGNHKKCEGCNCKSSLKESKKPEKQKFAANVLRNSLKKEFLNLLRKNISKVGYRRYKRKMTPSEWEKVSTDVCEKYLEEFFRRTGLDLADEYLNEKDMTGSQGDKILLKIIPKDYMADALETTAILGMKI